MKLFRSLTTLQMALAVSVLAHAALLTVRFVDPERFNRVFQDTPLEVILVNARSDEAPDKAQAIAQANLAGGGDVERGRATSPLPPASQARLGESLEEEERRIEAMKEQQNRLLAQLRRELAQLPLPDEKLDLSPEALEREQKRQALVKILAEIEKRISEENARPRKRYISPATREETYALYYDTLRRKIEERGTRNFPMYRGEKLYGELMMNFTVDASGQLVAVEVVRPSRQPELDRRAVAIVQAAAPFGGFSQAMRQQADQIVVTSRFRFTRSDQLETTLGATENRP